MLLIGLTACSDDPAKLYKDAEVSYRSGDYQRAIIGLKKLLQAQDTNQQARALLGRVYMLSGQYASAEKELRRAVTLGGADQQMQVDLIESLLYQRKHDDATALIKPLLATSQNDPVLNTMQGRLLLAGNDAQGAETYFERALAQQPSHVPALLGLAEVRGRGNDLLHAKEYLARALAAEPNNGKGLLMQAQIAQATGDEAGAVKIYGHVWGDIKAGLSVPDRLRGGIGYVEGQLRANNEKQASVVLDQIEKLYPNYPQMNYLQAVLFYKHDMNAQAEEKLLQVVKVIPDFMPAYLLLGAVQFRSAHYEQAAQHLQRYLGSDSTNIEAIKLMASVRLKQNRSQEAYDMLSARSGSDDPKLQGLLGVSALGKGDLSGGISAIKRAQSLGMADPTLNAALASAYIESGNLDQAIALLEGQLSGIQQQEKVVVMLVSAYVKQGKYGEAIAFAQKSQQKNPQSPFYNSLLASLYLQQREVRNAQTYYDASLKLDGRYIPALNGLAQLRFTEGKIADARKLYERALVVDAKNVQTLMGMALVSQKKGDDKATLDWLLKARDANPGAAQPRLALARYHLQRRETDKAMGMYDEILAAAPGSYDALLGKAMLLRALGQSAAAVRMLEQVTKSYPDAYIAHFELAQMKLLGKDIVAARRELNKVMQLRPDFRPAAQLLAELETDKGNSAGARQAVEQYRKAATPDAADLLQADLYMQQKKYNDALTIYNGLWNRQQRSDLALRLAAARRQLAIKDAYQPLQQWVDGHPDDANARFELAQGYMADGYNDEAIRQFEVLDKAYPANPVVLNNLAWLYHLKNDKRAVDTAGKALKAAPENGAIEDTLGWLQVLGGDVKSGLEHLQQAAKRAPAIPDIRYHLAVALDKTGQPAEAKRLLQKLIESNQPFAERDQAQQLYQRLK
ncbi:MAG: PEP-CTERM system TPR-repeat protein PrsT [Gammaproteobacteria bacterium]|nr:PEP-CTERM system TPR-repeat protein PrsT [Gammaproteobacteria bacterium]